MTQTNVVTADVVNAVLAKTTGFDPEKGSITRSEIVMTNAVAIAEISLHALIRHQYQRRRYTPPVPAPTSSTACHPERMSDSSQETPAEAITRMTVATREICT